MKDALVTVAQSRSDSQAGILPYLEGMVAQMSAVYLFTFKVTDEFIRLPVAQAAGDWLWIDAKVNGKPARLVLDTGCEPGLVLFKDTAKRLGLKLQEAEKRSTNQMPF
jgi:predicted aspartyl protease